MINFSILFGFLCCKCIYAAEPSKASLANDLATKILDAVHIRRNSEFLHSLNTPEMHASVDAGIITARANQAAVVANLPPKVDKHVRQFETGKLAVLNALDGDTHLTNIKNAVAGEKRFNTMSVMYYDDDMYLSGNVKTLELPSAPGDADWIQKAYRPKGFNVEWNGKEFGMQSADGVTAAEVMRRDDVTLPRHAKNLYMITPKGNRNIEGFQSLVLQAEIDKIMENPGPDSEQKIAKANDNVAKDVAAIYHAEVVHVTHHKKVTGDKKYNYLSPDAERPLLGTSKPLCNNCEDYVNQQNVFDYEQPPNQRGLDFDKVKNWGVPRDVVLEQVDLDADSTLISKQDSDTMPSTSGSDDMIATIPNGCSYSRRRRRGASSPCVFYVGKNKPLEWSNVEEIDGDAFMTKYATADPNTRDQMSQGAAGAKGATIFGPDSEVDDVSKIVRHEEIKSHEKTLQSSTDSMLKDEVDIDSDNTARVSPTTTAKQMSYEMKEFVAVGEAAQSAVGKILLVKSIVQGLAKGDATGLAIMGGRYAGSWILKHGAQHGANMFAKIAAATTKLGFKAGAEYASKALSTVSQYAGPIGGLIDIGFNSWHLSSAVKRLNNPNATKYERNDAIADIVKSSADIAITAVTTVASLAFPPFAPLFSLLGFFTNLFVSTAVAIYKAQNHVNMLDSKIRLLGFEKREEFNRNFMGKDTSAYIKNLIDTKNANNLFVNISIQLMEENPDIIAHVYPARTLELMANCKLMRKHCGFETFGGCWTPETPVVEADNCFQGQMCGNRVCESAKEAYTYASWNYYTCECPGGVGIKSGDPLPDQNVDFRQKQYLYPDRSSPDKPYLNTYEELCRPNAKYSKGYKYSEEEQSFEYYCYGAIATRRRDKSGKYMLYELEDGNDNVRAFPNTDNRFMVGNGKKKFYGGLASDTFIVTKCDALTGKLDGGKGDNTLVITNNCTKYLRVDLHKGRVTGGGSAVKFKVKSITNVYGRRGYSETIYGGCDTKYIAGFGGKHGNWDKVMMNRIDGCEVNVTVVADSYTAVKGGVTGVHTQVLIPRNAHHVTVTGKEDEGGVTTLVKHSSRELSSAKKVKDSLKILFGSNEITIEMAPHVNILLEENQGVPTQIVVEDSTPKCLHHLGPWDGYIRAPKYGCPNTPNLFDIKGHWGVTGGIGDDVFYIGGHVTSGTFDGSSGVDAVHFTDSGVNNVLTIDVDSGAAKGAGIQIKNVEAFYGRWNKTDLIWVGCSTPVVSARGGPSKNSPDVIQTNPKCTQNITMEVTSFSNIFAPEMKGKIQVYVNKSAASDTTMSLNMAPSGDTSITLPFPVYSLQIQKNMRGSVTVLQLSGVTKFLHVFTVYLSFVGKPEDSEYLSTFRVYFPESQGSSSTLLVPHDPTKTCLSFHTLSSNIPVWKSRKGNHHVPNYFRIVSGNWVVFGGDDDDVFELQSIPSGILEGGLGTNDVRLTSPTSRLTAQQVIVDLHGKTVSSDGRTAALENVHRFFGEELWKETVWIGCSTQLVVTGGKNIKTMDKVSFRGTPCLSNKLPHIRSLGFTRLDAPGNASFTAQVPFSKDPFQFEMNARLEANSSKTIFLQTHPHEVTKLTSQRQLTGDRKVSAKFTFGTEQNVIVRLSGATSSSEDFIQNIHIIFAHPNASNVSRASLRFQRNYKPLVVHEIENVDESKKPEVIRGAGVIPNYFKIRGGNVDKIVGGAEDDTFQVESASFRGKLEGGGGVNVIIPTCPTPNVNFATGIIICNGSSVGTLDNIQVGKGQSGTTETFVIGCDTKSVASGGGVSTNNPDMVVVVNISNCPSGPRTTIYVEGVTRVYNTWRGTGAFVYAVPNEFPFEIKLPPTTKASHVFRFQFGVNRVMSATLENKVLIVRLRSDKVLRFPIYTSSPNPRDNNPKIGFEMGKDRLDLSVDGTLILATFNIRDATSPFLGGIPGVRNDITVNVTKSSTLKGFRGADLDDHFHLVAIPGLRHIYGGGGDKNQITLHPALGLRENITVDLRTNGSLQMKSSNAPINVQLRNIQIAIGRSSYRPDSILPACDTLFVSGFQTVVVTKQKCDSHTNTLIQVDAYTNVLFKLEDGDRVFSNQTFHYKITSLRSFDVDSEFWMNIRHTEQIFHLPFDIGQLDALFYFHGRLYYELNGATYSHQIDTLLDFFQEFYGNPHFQTQDGFQIKITRHGEIVVVATIPPWSPVDDDVVASGYMELASKLQASFIIDGERNSSFIFAGHRQTRNVLTNSPSRSLLFGGGSNLTLYSIMNLESDVKIYPGFYDDDSVHTVDMTLVVMPVREGSKNHSKYVPSVIPGYGGNLEVVVQGYTGRVILVNGMAYAHRIRILLEAVMMTIDNNKLNPQDNRRKRSVNPDWYLRPSPLMLSPDWPVAVMSLQDLELGQEIIFQSNDTQGAKTLAELGKGLSETDSLTFQAYRNNDTLVLSTLAKGRGFNKMLSITLLDANKFPGEMLESIVVLANDTDEFPKTLSELHQEAFNEDKEDWKEALENIEYELLLDLPQVPRRFQQGPLYRVLWKRHRFVVVAALICLVLGFCSILVCLWKIVCIKLCQDVVFKWVKRSKKPLRSEEEEENCIFLVPLEPPVKNQVTRLVLNKREMFWRWFVPHNGISVIQTCQLIRARLLRDTTDN